MAPVRVNLIATGFVDTPLSASLLGDQLEARREELRTKLPIGRVVGPGDVAAPAVHIMCNEALTGATYDTDGGQQLIAGRSRPGSERAFPFLCTIRGMQQTHSGESMVFQLADISARHNGSRL